MIFSKRDVTCALRQAFAAAVIVTVAYTVPVNLIHGYGTAPFPDHKWSLDLS